MHHPLARRSLALALLASLGLALTGCAPQTTDAGCNEIDWSERGSSAARRDEVGGARAALTLESLAGTGGCSTAGAEAISAQLIDEMLCLAAGRLVRFEHANVTLTSSRVHPYLSPEGRDALYVAAASGEIQVNSALRTISDQYLLYAGCAVAATPGSSNHETGRALDVANYTARLSALLAAGFTHPLPGTDPVHFEAAGDDLRSLSVLAFQRLWNANHPADLIADDGVSGPQTLARLAMTPAEGFAIGHLCAATPVDAGTTPVDAGATPDDAGATPDDAGSVTPDAGLTPDDLGADAALDDGRPRATADAGCGCTTVGSRGDALPAGAVLTLAAALALGVRRRRRPAR